MEEQCRGDIGLCNLRLLNVGNAWYLEFKLRIWLSPFRIFSERGYQFWGIKDSGKFVGIKTERSGLLSLVSSTQGYIY